MDFHEDSLRPGPTDFGAAAAISKAAAAWLSVLDGTEEAGDRFLRPKRPDLTLHVDVSGIRAFVPAVFVEGPPRGASNLEALDARTRLRTAEERAEACAAAANTALSFAPGIDLAPKDRLQLHFESESAGRIDRGSAAFSLQGVWTAAPILDFGRKIDPDALSRVLSFARVLHEPLADSSSGTAWKPMDWRIQIERPLDPRASFCGFFVRPDADSAARQAVWSSLFDGWGRHGRIHGLDVRVRPVSLRDIPEPWIFTSSDLRRSLGDEDGAAAAMARFALDRFEEDHAAGERGKAVAAAWKSPCAA